jgi:hypothetical protein
LISLLMGRSEASNATRQLDARVRQAAKEFPHQENIGFLELVIVAELELIGLGHDQSLIRVSENSLLLQSIGASPDGLHGQSQKT